MRGLYPSEEQLAKIAKWGTDFHGLFEYISTVWVYYGIIRKHGNTYKMSTGGWSGNEEIMSAMRDNRLFWVMCWEKSERGGHYVFKVPKFKTTKPSGARAIKA